MANFEYVELRFGVTGQLSSMFEFAGVATAKLLTKPAKSSRKAMIPIEITFLTPSSVSTVEEYCWTQEVTFGLDSTFALRACVSAVAALVFIAQKGAFEIIADSGVAAMLKYQVLAPCRLASGLENVDLSQMPWVVQAPVRLFDE